MFLFMTVYKTGFKQADPIFTSYQSHGWFHQENSLVLGMTYLKDTIKSYSVLIDAKFLL